MPQQPRFGGGRQIAPAPLKWLGSIRGANAKITTTVETLFHFSFHGDFGSGPVQKGVSTMSRFWQNTFFYFAL